jgi:hypothetical protein
MYLELDAWVGGQEGLLLHVVDDALDGGAELLGREGLVDACRRGPRVYEAVCRPGEIPSSCLVPFCLGLS